jgi:hypothetical protein
MMYRGMEVKLHAFLTSAVDESEWLALRSPSTYTYNVERERQLEGNEEGRKRNVVV